MSVAIFHNPACATPRNTPRPIRNAGVAPTIIEYLTTPASRDASRDPIVKEDGQVVIDTEGRRLV